MSRGRSRVATSTPSARSSTRGHGIGLLPSTYCDEALAERPTRAAAAEVDVAADSRVRRVPESEIPAAAAERVPAGAGEMGQSVLEPGLESAHPHGISTGGLRRPSGHLRATHHSHHVGDPRWRTCTQAAHRSRPEARNSLISTWHVTCTSRLHRGSQCSVCARSAFLEGAAGRRNVASTATCWPRAPRHSRQAR